MASPEVESRTQTRTRCNDHCRSRVLSGVLGRTLCRAKPYLGRSPRLSGTTRKPHCCRGSLLGRSTRHGSARLLPSFWSAQTEDLKRDRGGEQTARPQLSSLPYASSMSSHTASNSIMNPSPNARQNNTHRVILEQVPEDVFSVLHGICGLLLFVVLYVLNALNAQSCLLHVLSFSLSYVPGVRVMT